MLLADIFSPKTEIQKKNSQNKARFSQVLERPGTIVDFKMELHVPCRIAGLTRNGSHWEGKTTTVSINSFGAHVLLPYEAELEGDVVLTLRVPAALECLLNRRRFPIEAEVKPSGAAGPTLAPTGQKLTYVAFFEPLYFGVSGSTDKNL